MKRIKNAVKVCLFRDITLEVDELKERYKVFQPNEEEKLLSMWEDQTHVFQFPDLNQHR
jgi:hypothetical protein